MVMKVIRIEVTAGGKFDIFWTLPVSILCLMNILLFYLIGKNMTLSLVISIVPFSIACE